MNLPSLEFIRWKKTPWYRLHFSEVIYELWKWHTSSFQELMITSYVLFSSKENLTQDNSRFTTPRPEFSLLKTPIKDSPIIHHQMMVRRSKALLLEIYSLLTEEIRASFLSSFCILDLLVPRFCRICNEGPGTSWR